MYIYCTSSNSPFPYITLTSTSASKITSLHNGIHIISFVCYRYNYSVLRRDYLLRFANQFAKTSTNLLHLGVCDERGYYKDMEISNILTN